MLGIIGNQLSREIEASADTFALELTDDPDALIDLQRRFAVANVADPDPPGIVTELLAPTLRRSTGSARRRRGSRASGP